MILQKTKKKKQKIIQSSSISNLFGLVQRIIMSGR